MFRVKSPARLIGNQQAFLNSKNVRFFSFLSVNCPLSRKSGRQDWQLGTLGRDFTFGYTPSGVNIENYVLSLLNLLDVTSTLEQSTGAGVFNYLLLQVTQGEPTNLPA
jgi:hypothetical protein